MKHQLWRLSVLTVLLLALSSIMTGPFALAESGATDTDRVSVDRSQSFAPTFVGSWETDRRTPTGGWESTSFAGRDNVLRLGIDHEQAASSTFQRTEGMQRATAAPVTAVEVDLYIDPTWETTAMRAGIWTVGHRADGTTRSDAYGIFEFSSAAGHVTGGSDPVPTNPTFRVWTSGLEWTELPELPIPYGEWVRLGIKLDLDTQSYHFSLNGDEVAVQAIPVGTSTIVESASIGRLFINSLNFGNEVPGDLDIASYSAHWHGLKTHNVFDSIQPAVDLADAGDTIQVGPGTYAENVVLNKDGLQLIGAGPDASVIAPTSGHAISIAGHTTGELSGIGIGGFELTSPNGFGLIALSGTVDEAPTTLDLTVTDVVTDRQIVLNAVDGATFERVSISDTNGVNGSGGLELTGVANLDISDSRFTDNELAIRLQSTEGLSAVEYGDNGPLSITDSILTGNTVAIENGDDEVTITAPQNWWGCGDGPGAAGCDTVSGDVTTLAPLSAEIVNLSAPSNVSHSTTNVTPGVTLANPHNVTVEVTGHENLSVGDNTVTAVSTLTVAGQVVDTDSAQVVVRRATAPASPSPSPTTPPSSVRKDASPGEPVVAESGGARTTVTVPSGGTVAVSVERTTTDTEPANGLSFLNFTVNIEAPDATPEEPLVLDFRLDPEIASEIDPGQLVVFRNGVPVPLCTGPAGVAEPDPCVAGFSGVEAGELQFQVLTSRASVWTLARVTGACPTLLVPESGFVDTSGIHAANIDCVAWWGITEGVDDERFAPTRDVTRAQMASFLSRILNKAGVTLPAREHGFTDVPTSNVHSESINQLAALEIVNGYPDGSFRPGASITRAQMATMVVGAYEFITQVEIDSSDAVFSDTGDSVHRDAINKAANADLLRGINGSMFDPSSNTTRAQLATTLRRMLDQLLDLYLVELPR